MSDELPFRAEYSKSNRAACKGCREKIDKDVLRLAIMIQSPRFDGKMPNWFHPPCFFQKSRVKNVDDIQHFDQLRWEDQEMIRKCVGGSNDEFVKKQTSGIELEDFVIEYAKSNRSACRDCTEKIEKGTVRISKKDFESQRGKQLGGVDQWYHVDCFVKSREELDFYASGEKIKGFSVLNADDKEEIKRKLPIMKEGGSSKKRSKEEGNGSAKKQKTDSSLDKDKLKAQNGLIFAFRDKLQVNWNKKDWSYLIKYNEQEIPEGESKHLDRLSDCMAFGALERCPECKNGQLVYQREGYRCHGNVTEWTKCTYMTKNPPRKAFKIPDELAEKYDFLKAYKYQKQDRLFPPEATPTTSKASSSGSSKNLPLEGMSFVIVGKLKKPSNDITTAIADLGGKVSSKITSKIAAVISTEDEVKKMTKKIQQAKEADVHVVSEDFVDAAKKGRAALIITEKSICGWGSDPMGRVVTKPESKKRKADETMFTKQLPEKLKMKVKGGAAVDPDSELEDVAHVLEDKTGIYNFILGLVDIERGTNSYYKLQILESDKGSKYWLFRSWGRVGTTIGGNKKERFDTKADAIAEFNRLYEDKTGNLWKNRENFVKHPNKFFPLDIDYGQEDDNVKKLTDLKKNSKSKLHKAIQDLVCMIFDIESMKKTMVEFEIDLKKMPLGKLSNKQIKNAYLVLTEVLELLDGKVNQTKILDASNRFYTLIPHDFGLKKPTLLDNKDLIKQKLDMLDSLLDIELAYNMLKGAEKDTKEDPIDAYYKKLNTDLETVPEDSEDFKRILKYIKNTHASTHTQYDLKVRQVFKVARHGEASRYKPFKKLHNKKLLWHGSRLTNYAGILSKGLRIAPPEAPVTGYMFGKGVYFADMVSKSANYCNTTKDNPVGLLLLCEVALGDMYERTKADFITQLPDGKHSTKGIGSTAPDPSKTEVVNGVEIPLGKGVKYHQGRTSLLYNEYIVYDVAQVNVKYMVEVDFKWKY